MSRSRYGYHLMGVDPDEPDVPQAVLDRHKVLREMWEKEELLPFVPPDPSKFTQLFEDYWLFEHQIADELILYEGRYWMFSDSECTGYFESLGGANEAISDDGWDWES